MSITSRQYRDDELCREFHVVDPITYGLAYNDAHGLTSESMIPTYTNNMDHDQDMTPFELNVADDMPTLAERDLCTLDDTAEPTHAELKAIESHGQPHERDHGFWAALDTLGKLGPLPGQPPLPI